MSRLDGVALLLQGSTSLTVDGDSWRRLAEVHSENATPTKSIIFEISRSSLVETGCCESVGGGVFDV